MAYNDKSMDTSAWDEIKIDGWFTALIPPEWEVEDDREVLIFDPNGFGEMSVSLVSRDKQKGKRQRAAAVISGWADELGSHDEYEIIMFKRSRDLLIASAEFTSSEPEGELIYWRIFPVIGEKRALDINYSCPVEDREREEDIIEAIVNSVRLIEPKEEPLIKERTS